jgi:SAM-dependent methyltransferase
MNYLLEDPDEFRRLEVKTDPEAVRKQAYWCEVKPGFRVLDVGCGSGKTTAILHELVQPGGEVVGVDTSAQRVAFARAKYGNKKGISFRIHDATVPISGAEEFDLVWVRFFLEFHRQENFEIVKNLARCLRPGGSLCLLDLDHNCLNHYEMPPALEKALSDLIHILMREYNFDPYAGRKLYSHLYDLNFDDIQIHMVAHHLLFGSVREEEIFNWLKKVETVSRKAPEACEYPGGWSTFFKDFEFFLRSPRRFTYTPLILCKGRKPHQDPL